MTSTQSRTVLAAAPSRLLAEAAVALAAACIVVVGVIGLLIGHVLLLLGIGIVLGAGMAAAVIVRIRADAERRALALFTLRPADAVVDARLINLVDGLCTAAGLTRPQLWVHPSSSPNSLTLGRDARHGALIVTEGLLTKLSRIELEGVLAHELSHLMAGDTIQPTLALALCGSAAPGVSARLAVRGVRPSREAAADLAGVALTRYPPGLLGALERVQADPEPPADGPPAARDLWLRPSGTGADLHARIETLQEL